MIAWTRLGDTYRPAHLQQALEQDRTLFEVPFTRRITAAEGELNGLARWLGLDDVRYV
jgi:hypothetical protein